MYTLQYRQWLRGEGQHAVPHDELSRNDELQEGLDSVVKNIETVRTKFHDCLESDDDGRDELEIAEVMLSNVARALKNEQEPTIQDLQIANRSAELLDDAKARLASMLRDQQRIDDEAPCGSDCTSEHVHQYSKAIAKVNDASTKLNDFIREIVHDML